MTYLLARVENFSRFQGENLTADPVMKYGQSGRVPHEIFNFHVASDGFIYAYLPKEGGGDLSRLGGSRGDTEISNVTIIFISDGVLCGYYRNATVFSQLIAHPDGLEVNGLPLHIRAKVDPKNAFLIPLAKRNDKIQPRPKGQFPVLYGDDDSEWVNWFQGLAIDTEHFIISEEKRKKWTENVERSSSARAMALRTYGWTCESCKITHDDCIRASIFEVHHKVVYAENFETRRLKASDLAVLCANCHRMIHKMPDVSDVDALRDYLMAVQGGGSEVDHEI